MLEDHMYPLMKVPSRKIRTKAVLQYCLLIPFVLTHNTWFYSLYDMKFRGVIILISAVVFMTLERTREIKLLLTFMAIFVITMLYDFWFIEDLNIKIPLYNFLFLIEPIMITAAAYRYDEENFCDRFIKLVLFLAVVSLFFYVVGLIDADFLIRNHFLHKVQMKRLTYTDYYCNLFYALRTRELDRNVGMFCEPGLYQILLISAIYILVFYPEKSKIRHQYVSMFLLIVTLITTKSATGMLSLLIVIGGIALSNRRNFKRTFRRIFWSCVLAVSAIVMIDLTVNGSASYVYKVLLEKVLNIGSSEPTTGSVRMLTMKTMTQLIIANPFGYGFSYVSDYLKAHAEYAVAAEIFVTAGAIGIMPMCYCLYYFFKKGYYNRKRFIQFAVLILLYFNIALAQSREFYPAILVLFYLKPNPKAKGQGIPYQKSVPKGVFCET